MEEEDRGPLYFRECGLKPAVLEGVEARRLNLMGLTQCAAVPRIVQGHSLLMVAAHSAGKSLAAMVGLLDRVNTGRLEPQVVVVAPSPRDAVSFARVVRFMGKVPRVKVVVFTEYDHMRACNMRCWEGGFHVVVGTPMRLCALQSTGALDLAKSFKLCVLDAASYTLRVQRDLVASLCKRLPADTQYVMASTEHQEVVLPMAAGIVPCVDTIEVIHVLRSHHPVNQMKFYVTVEGDRTPPLDRDVDSDARSLAKIDVIVNMYQTLLRRKATTVMCTSWRRLLWVQEQLEARGLATARLYDDYTVREVTPVAAGLKNGSIQIVLCNKLITALQPVANIWFELPRPAMYDKENCLEPAHVVLFLVADDEMETCRNVVYERLSPVPPEVKAYFPREQSP